MAVVFQVKLIHLIPQHFLGPGLGTQASQMHLRKWVTMADLSTHPHLEFN